MPNQAGNPLACKRSVTFILAVLILVVCNGLLYRGILVSEEKSGNDFEAEFPSVISEWKGIEVVYDPEVLSKLAPDRIVYKTYHGKRGLPVTLFLACYNSVEKADLSHSPIVCFTGQGWEISETRVDEIAVSRGDTATISVNGMVQNKLNTKMITLYWYQSARRTFTNRGVQKIVLFFESMLGKSSRNAFVRITAVVPQDKTLGYAKEEMYRFVYDLYPELRVYLR